MLTHETLLGALGRLPRHDQLITDWIRAEGWTIGEFESFLERASGADRSLYIEAGLKFRAASYGRTIKAGTFVVINKIPFADIRGKR